MALLIYGANGYTGALIAERAATTRVPAIIAARRADTVEALGARLGLTTRVFGLENPAGIDAALEGVKVVLNCAGPFSRTATPLVDACLRARVHYLDITGELEVLESLAGRDAEARAAGITVLPATGFDVVPSDGLAAEAKHRLPSATHLALAFKSSSRLSRGTSMTAIENLDRGGAVRRDGVLVRVPSGWKTRTIAFGDGKSRQAITIPWGDVSTAFHTTGIPNIEVYAAVPRALRVGMRLARWTGSLLGSAQMQRFLKARVQAAAAGPSAEERAQGVSRLWAEARDEAGRTVTLLLETPDAYELTSWTALALAERALRGELPVGFQTPTSAAGRAFVLQFPGVRLRAADDAEL